MNSPITNVANNMVDLFTISHEIVREIVLLTYLPSLKDLILSNSIFLKSLRKEDMQNLHNLHFESYEEEIDMFTLAREHVFRNPDYFEELKNGKVITDFTCRNAEPDHTKPCIRHGPCVKITFCHHDGVLTPIVITTNYRYGKKHGTITARLEENGKLFSVEYFNNDIPIGLHKLWGSQRDVVVTFKNGYRAKIETYDGLSKKLVTVFSFDKYQRILYSVQYTQSFSVRWSPSGQTEETEETEKTENHTEMVRKDYIHDESNLKYHRELIRHHTDGEDVPFYDMTIEEQVFDCVPSFHIKITKQIWDANGRLIEIQRCIELRKQGSGYIRNGVQVKFLHELNRTQTEVYDMGELTNISLTTSCGRRV